MSEQPLVSVIMNCYNSATYLREAIESVLGQTYQNWEIIFWDNQSTDESAQIVKSYNDSRIKYFYAPVHTTLGAARNCALRECRGEFISLLDCDDLFLPERLQVFVRMMQKDDKLGMVYSDCYFIDKTGKISGAFFKGNRPHRGKIFKTLLSKPNFIPCPAVLVRRTVIQQVGGFDIEIKYSEEYELFLRVASIMNISFCSEPLAKYRIHGANMAGVSLCQMTQETIQIIQRYSKLLPHLTVWERLGLCRRVVVLHLKKRLSRSTGCA